jgi:hypothetical protein
MQTGLLWYDNDPRRELAVKVEEAAQRYREKFGSTPNTCYVNQAELNGQSAAIAVAGMPGALRVLPARNILPHHFWIGIEEGVSAARAA